MPDTPNREREIFITALEFAAGAERAGFLDDACEGDPELRRRVEALLATHNAAGGFLEEPNSSEPEGARLLEPRVGELPGARIDRYKLLEQIGEGGFGVVYMAEQQEPVRRRVALKIIKLGMDTRAVVARFEAERQALAMMDHPNIARVLDGGATETGRPFFVMELVRGVPITKLCDERRLTTRERIELFMQVCNAVQHAHQKGVIHRDLKPSNILVTMHDDRPVTKVIDFGIAKATELRLTEKTLFTHFHQFVGTPAYMSPEQTGISGLDVDTRSDIYSLGVLLYELLTDRTPFDTRKLLQAGYEEIQRLIREKEPPAPSNLFASLSRDEQTTAAERRRLDPARLTSQLRGDLDRVVMKCLEKDRARRYETASALAQDLARHLNHQPVLARPDTLAYRVAKFTRRHARGVSVAGVIALLLAGLVGFHTMQLATERDRARHEAQKAAKVAELLTQLLAGADPYRTPDAGAKEPTLRSILDAGAERVRRELVDESELQAEMFTVIGRVYQRLGYHEKARPLLEQALAAGRGAGWEDERVAQTLNDLGVLLRERGDYAAAGPLLRDALATRRRLFGNEHKDVAVTLVELGRVYCDQGLNNLAEPLLREALEIRRAVLGEDHRETATSMSDLGLLLRDLGDLAGAKSLLSQSLETTRKALGADHANSATALANLALILAQEGDYLARVRIAEGDAAGAEPLLRRALEMRQRAFPDSDWRVGAARSLLGAALTALGRFEEAETMLLDAEKSLKPGLSPEGRDASATRERLAVLYESWGRPEKAAAYRTSIGR